MTKFNVVIGGSFQGQKIKVLKSAMFIGNIQINKETVDHYEIMDENTTTLTNGHSKRGMVRSGAKGAVGATIGTIIAPGVGTLIGAGAGVTSAKKKNKSVSKTTKEVIVAVFFKTGEQSLVKMDGEHYEKFLGATFSNPIQPKVKKEKEKVKREKVKKDKQSNQLIWKSLGWFVVPYIMLPVYWKKLTNQNRIAGIVWTIIAIIILFQGK